MAAFAVLSWADDDPHEATIKTTVINQPTT